MSRVDEFLHDNGFAFRPGISGTQAIIVRFGDLTELRGLGEHSLNMTAQVLGSAEAMLKRGGGSDAVHLYSEWQYFTNAMADVAGVGVLDQLARLKFADDCPDGWRFLGAHALTAPHSPAGYALAIEGVYMHACGD